MRTGLVLLGVIALSLSACPRNGESPVRYKSLEAAIDANAVDRRIVDELNKSGRVSVLATLDYKLPPLELNEERRTTSQQEQWLNGVRKDLVPLKDAVHKRHPGLEPLTQFDSFPIMFVQVNKPELLLALLNDVVILSVAPDMESDYLLSQSLPLVRATNARQARATGAGVGVALIDSGINFSNTTFGTCSTVGATGCRVVASEDIGTDDGAADNVGHGTNMAATILGVAPSASLVVLDAGIGTAAIRDSNAIAALNRVLALRGSFNIRAANMSFGHDAKSWSGFCSGRDAYVMVFGILRSVGIAPVVASGNSGRLAANYLDGMDRPACIPGAVSVGAVYDSASAITTHAGCTDTAAAVDAIPCFSQSDPNLKALAPGADIDVLMSTNLTGTSLAAAFVSGSIATLTAFRPAMTVAQIESSLAANGPSIADARNSVTRRRLDVLAMLDKAAGPSHDAFANARNIVGGVSSAEGSTFLATKETGEPNHASVAGGSSIWFKWTANYTGPAKILTAGTNFDHVIAIYTGTSVNSLTSIASDKPLIPTNPMPVPASVNFNAVLGTTYMIAIDGQPIGSLLQRGTARLTLNGPPANNQFVDAISLLQGTMATGLNVGGSREAGEIEHCGNDGGASVWYKFQAPTTSSFTVDTGMTMLRCADVWQAAVPTQTPGPLVSFALQKVAGNLWSTPDDTTTATFNGTAGNTYFIAVDGISSEQPPYQAPSTGQFSIVVR
jgi:hypothetical protein